MNKRGAYFFVIDALLAASIIFLSLMIIFTSYSMVPESAPSLRMVTDYSNFLASTKIRQFSGSYVESLKADGNISIWELDNTLLEQLTVFYYNDTHGGNKEEVMAKFMNETAQGIIPEQRSIAVYMNSTLIFNRTNAQSASSRLLLSAKRFCFKSINSTYVYGPVIMEVRLWV